MRLTRIAIITVLLITLFLPLVIQTDSIAHADGTGVEYWAVIVGVYNYVSYSISNVLYADDDATSLYQQLAPIYGSDHIDLITNYSATKSAVQSSIQNWLAQHEDSNDVVIFYFSGHGGTDGSNYYICPTNSDPYSWSNDISVYELNNWLSVLDSNNVAVILDTCRSGGFTTGLSSNSQVIMTACTPSESAYGSPSLLHGVFTYYLLQATNSVISTDTNSDYVISTQEVFDYASPKATQWEAQKGNSQHPVYYGSSIPLFLIASISTNLASGTVTLDGTQYTNLLSPRNISLTPNKSHQIMAQSEIANGTNTRYAFQSWNDGSTTPTRTIYQGGQYIADYGTQYYLAISANYGSISGGGWYNSGTTASTGTAQDTITNGSTRYVFQHWDVDGTPTTGNPITVSMYSPHTAYADYKTQHYLSVSADHGTVVGTGWYDYGAVISTGTAPETITEGNTRYIFQHWDVDNVTKTENPVAIYMYHPHTAIADYKTQYYLDIQSKYSDASGEGWYDSDTAAQVSVTPVVGTLIRHKFNGWSGDSNDDYSSTSVYMNQPKSIVATWKADYLYLYLLIGSVLGVCILIAVLLTVRIRGRRLSRRIAKKQKRYA